MSWQGILGHDEVAAQFRRALERGRLASSFLFVGPAGIGKRTFAVKLAQTLLCQRRPEAEMDPCGQCPSCAQVMAATHPDLEIVGRPKDKAFIPLELLIGDKDRRGREGLCHSIAMKPFMGGRKVAIIDDADYLNAEGANSLLKTLEEPPPRSLLVLIGTSPAKQLPTIRSRCQIVRFRALASEAVAELLAAQGLAQGPEEAARLAGHSGGSLERAMELTGAELWQFRTMLDERLSEPGWDGVLLAEAVSAFVAEAGSETSARRARMRQVFEFAAEFYRHLLYVLTGSSRGEDPELERLMRRAAERWPADEAAALACLDRSIEAMEQLERNAYQPTLLECWIDDLVKTTLFGRAPLR
ncbi:MAG: DNA polymerase III subunit delta' [Pirellulales bacterium]|nr:DNA polymerase III subunit delta' [Pirellulales bacterium]